MNGDDQFDVNCYRDCMQYNVEKNDNNAKEEQVQYNIGPGCTKGGTGVKLGLYTDATCTTATSTAFADISNGGTLSYADGGLVSTYCTDCTETDDHVYARWSHLWMDRLCLFDCWIWSLHCLVAQE